MQAYGQIGKTALPEAHLSAVGEQAVVHNLSGISGKKGMCRDISGCHMLALDKQCIMPASMYRF